MLLRSTSGRSGANADCGVAMPAALAEGRGRALVNRGVTYGQLGQSQRAIEDSDAVLAMPDAPVEQKTKALLGRSMANADSGNTAQAEEENRAFLAMPEAKGLMEEIVRKRGAKRRGDESP